MAKLDQSFIKAYGHVGARGAGSRAAQSKLASASEPAAALPLLSAAPIVVDAGAFAVDEPCVETHNAATLDRVAPRTARRLPAKPQPRETPSPESVESASAFKAPPFQATSFSVDTFVGKNDPVGEVAPKTTKRPIPTPAARRPAASRSPVPARAEAASPRFDRANLCHRACTEQFATSGDVEPDELRAIEPHRGLSHDPYHDVVEESADEITNHAAEADSFALRVDGIAYHRMSAQRASNLRAGYEVDAFRWPPIVAGLAGRATTALSTLIDELVDASSGGRGVVMFAGERRGAGATTLAAYAARRLAELGLSVALVDADFARPTLARSLGIAVDHGWDEALDGRSDFAAALIASLDDGVTMLPLRRASTNVNGARAAQIAADLAVLRQQFTLVVIDGGLLAEAEAWLNHAPEDTVDCGIVVRDVRIDAGQRVAGRPHSPRAAALSAIGVVENFVGGAKTPNK